MSDLPLLAPQQLAALDPARTVWLSASAGTGKTEVLASRVLRLLLQPDVRPEQILCLTFTKAGAAEMASRINATLARWVRLPGAALASELKRLGAAFGPDDLPRARTRFAAVLDCPGGGLRINTIHAFAQWLLAAFPEEAGLSPGTRAIEDRERDLLARRVLGDLLVDAEERGDRAPGDALAALSLRMAGDAVEAWLLRCAEARALWFGPGAWQPPLRPRINQALGLEADADPASLADLCADGAFDCAALHRCLAVYAQWSAATGTRAAQAIRDWLGGAAPLRLETLDELAKHLFTQDGRPKNLASLEKIDPAYADAAECVQAAIERVRERRKLLELAHWLTPALALGRQFALAWDEAKAREGLVDFDDQIARAAALLGNADMAGWIGYKLDRRLDHILVDEAQDTNAEQWEIIDALTREFFAGAGQKDDKLRTLFVVGDYKQAIFRFQGTSPENFRNARERVERTLRAAAAAAREARALVPIDELLDVDLTRSFRTAQDVLDVVDGTLGALGAAAIGLDSPADRHVGLELPGRVVLWPPVAANGDEEGDDEGAEGWLSRPDREMADRIARQVKGWLAEGFTLNKGAGDPRRARAGDVLVLVRKRRELAGLIVARLHAAGVPVAGVDRLRLGAPLAVRDLLSALAFAAQPLDDLALAELLVSPLIGWSQDALLAHGYRDDKVRLWDHLRASRAPDAAAVVERLGGLLARADFVLPHALLEWLLVGEWQGRRALVARLGREANDPIDELLNAARAYAATSVASIAGFLAWFEAGAGEVKREAEGAGDRVRVLTVHGAKGLQAPIVILADAAGNPDSGRAPDLELVEPARPGSPRRAVPLPPLRGDERAGPVRAAAEEAKAEDLKEHWRLFYVAMTRAEEALFVGGALGRNESEPAAASWYARLADQFALCEAVPDPVWGTRLELGSAGAAAVVPRADGPSEASIDLPGWLRAAPADEPRPPRPLAPSALGEEAGATPPLAPGPAAADAARRGVLLHRLLERLPALAPERRAEAAAAWLSRTAADLAPTDRESLAAAALAVIAAPDWAELFAPDALAEVPFAATIGGVAIAGTIDRLVVGADAVRLVDFKTARAVPPDAAAVPAPIVRQMAAYRAALAVLYPGRRIDTALLYTSAPRLIALPDALLDAHVPAPVAESSALPR